jgi:hypothetical protein
LPWALPVFCGECLQRLDVQRLLRHHLFQPPVFVFQLAEFLHITDFQSGIFRPPLLKGGIRDAVLAAELLDPNARLGVLEHGNNLLLRVPFPCLAPSCGPHLSTVELPSQWSSFQGEGQQKMMGYYSQTKKNQSRTKNEYM